MKSFIARHYIQWLTRRAERVFFVYGMRRSGNHACIGWLINALEGKDVSVAQSEVVPNFNFTETGRTVFVNDITGMSSEGYFRFLHLYRREIRAARFIIISAEDQAATYINNWRIPSRSESILVRRSTLNLMASRYHNINRRARQGWGAALQSMRGKFFETLKSNRNSDHQIIWNFEKWSADSTWRAEFLDKLGLEQDITPPVWPPGLGSSFSGTKSRPSFDQLSKRYNTVEPWESWVTFIRNAASDHPDVFDKSELDVIKALGTTAIRCPAAET